uniref:RING-type domain-containing protein n=1 Tax=Panagrolaimus superbus TaxID=310955 RepID=A0A914XVE3_9BILA
MADERRETLLRMFPDYDADILIASMTNASVEQIADWCLNNPERVPMKRKGEKRRHPESAPSSPGGENDSDSDLEFDDIADGLLLDRLIKELLNRLKKEMLLQENKCETFSNEIKFVIMAVYPKLRMDFLRHAFQESGSRLCATLIIGFFVSNKLTQRLRDSMPNPQSNMWVMTDPLNATRKRYALDIFDGDISHYPEQITTPIRKFVTMMNALAEKYPRIINRLELLPEAFQLRLDVPDDIEKFDCAVCFSEYTITRRIMCGAGPSTGPEDERHSFCRNCVKHQAQAATEDMPLAEGGIGLKCMEYKCTHAILYSAVRNLIPKKVRRKIDERIMEENIGNAGLNLERCRECNFAIEMEESKEDNKDNDHFGISCAELDDKNKVDKKQRELERRLNEAVIRKCKCGLQFTKSDGCNKMTCRCGKTQCYLCRKEGINYTHFCQHVRVPGAPQQQCQQCDKACTLWADANQLDQQLIQRIRAENDEAVANPDGPGPSRPHAVRRLSPVYRPVPNMVPFFPAAPMQYRMPEMVQQQQPPAAPLRHHHYMPDGFNFGFHNGPQGFNVNVNIENPHNHDGDRLARRNEERMQREMVRQRNRELVRQVQIARRDVENAQERAINIARMRDEQYERLQQLRATEEATANMRQDRERLMQMFNDNQAVIRNINQNGVIPEAHPQRRELNFAPQQPLPAPRRRAEIRFAEPKIRNREPQFPDEATAANINQNGQMQQQLQPLMRRHQHFNPTLNLPAPAVHQRQQPNAQNGKAMAINVNRNHEIQHNQRQQLPVFETKTVY